MRVHLLPEKPNDVEDNGEFHYVVLGPKAASASGKPSAEAKRFLDETTGPEKPRVFRNAVVIAVPAREGLEMARNRVLDYLAWEEVHNDLKKQEGEIEGVRMASLRISLDKAKKAVPGAIRQAYCIVVTVGSDNEVQAFKISVPETDDPLFSLIKADKRSRIQDTAVTADALLPGGPYDLWHEGDTSRRVKDLVGAFAQLPHLPKMLATKAILDTLVSGCVQGGFVLRLVRPDRSFRTWWKATPDEEALKAPALEVVSAGSGRVVGPLRRSARARRPAWALVGRADSSQGRDGLLLGLEGRSSGQGGVHGAGADSQGGARSHRRCDWDGRSQWQALVAVRPGQHPWRGNPHGRPDRWGCTSQTPAGDLGHGDSLGDTPRRLGGAVGHRAFDCNGPAPEARREPAVDGSAGCASTPRCGPASSSWTPIPGRGLANLPVPKTSD